VWRRPDGRALVATVDVFTPIVDDPRTWGRIAAVNAASDVYAMGGTPLFALAIAAWPRDRLPLDVLADVLAGGQEAAEEGGWVVAGGHTIDGPEPLYGQAVVGEVDVDRLLTNAGGRPGDALVLTKPVGTGLLATAVKRRPVEAVAAGGELADLYRVGVREMTRSNADAAAAALDLGAVAATDVTGFGLLGHLRELARASGVDAVVEVTAVPRLDGVTGLVAAGEVPGGTLRNLEHVRPYLDAPGVDEHDLVVLADAQTSGGLLVALPPDRADELAATLRASGHTAAVVGHLTDPAADPGHLTVRGSAAAG
jgi:selenide, water dikinase